MDINHCSKCGCTHPVGRNGYFDYENVIPCSVHCPECGESVSIKPPYDDWDIIRETMEDVIERWNKGEYDDKD